MCIIPPRVSSGQRVCGTTQKNSIKVFQDSEEEDAKGKSS